MKAGREARLKYMVAAAAQSETYEEFKRVFSGLTTDYDVRDCVWPVVDINEMPMVGEAVLERRERVFSFTPPAVFAPGGKPAPAAPIELDLLITSDRRPTESRRYLLVKNGTRDILAGARLTLGQEVSLDTIATSGPQRQGLASFLLGELRKDFPQAAYKPPFSQQGFMFFVKQEGFEGLEDFYRWAREQEPWQ